MAAEHTLECTYAPLDVFEESVAVSDPGYCLEIADGKVIATFSPSLTGD
jgi:hypothetical protein